MRTRGAAGCAAVEHGSASAVRPPRTALGVQLQIRTSRRVALTPAGQTLLDEARIALDAYDVLPVELPASGWSPPDDTWENEPLPA